jgi:Restriction endonuclease NaeI
MSAPNDPDFERVWDQLQKIQGLQQLLAQTLRQALDEVIDGARTGRYAVAQLEKTEKTYIGTKVEILLGFAFEWPRGDKPDNLIANVEVDTKFSLTGNWMIPREALGQICLLASANDVTARFQVGLLRMTPEVLRSGTNQDGKTSVSSEGKKRIRWLCFDKPMAPNFLLNLDPDVLAKVQAHRSGKSRIAAFFEQVTDVLIPRSVVLQIIKLPGDPMKRAREAKALLLPRGYRVLCATYRDDRQAMRDAGFVDCADDDWLSLKL